MDLPLYVESYFDPRDFQIELKKIRDKQHGVYLFLNKYNEALYVGRSKEIKTRLLNHFTGNSKNTKHFIMEINSVSLFETENDEYLSELESYLIKEFNPKYNQMKNNKTNLRKKLEGKYKRNCKALTKSKNKCMLSALSESDYCKRHGGIGKTWIELVDKEVDEINSSSSDKRMTAYNSQYDNERGVNGMGKPANSKYKRKISTGEEIDVYIVTESKDKQIHVQMSKNPNWMYKNAPEAEIEGDLAHALTDFLEDDEKRAQFMDGRPFGIKIRMREG